MFETLKPTPPDKIIELIGLFRADPRDRQARPRRRRLQGRRGPHPGDARGQGRRGAAARRAGHQGLRRPPRRPRLRRPRWAISRSATRCPRERLAGAQTPGRHRGDPPALRADPPGQPRRHRLASPTRPGRTTRRSSRYLGMPARTYRYFDAATRGVDFAGMMADLAGLKAGDVLLLHGCCHNPTGANLDLDQWRELTEFVLTQRRGADDRPRLPGLRRRARGRRRRAPPHGRGGAGDDARGELLEELRPLPRPGRRRLRAVRRHGDRPRSTRIEPRLAQPAQLLVPARPRRQGGRDDPRRPRAPRRLDGRARGDAPAACWTSARASPTRCAARPTPTASTSSPRTAACSPASAPAPEQVAALRKDHGIYMVGDSRINIAGLPADGLDKLARAMVAVGA